MHEFGIFPQPAGIGGAFSITFARDLFSVLCGESAAQQTWGLQLLTNGFEILARSRPAKLIEVVEHRHIQAKGRERAKQEGIFPCVEQRFGESAGPLDGWMPLPPILRDVFEMRILR